MKTIIFISLIILASCSELLVTRSPASVETNCTNILGQLLNDKKDSVKSWDVSRLKKIYDNSLDLKYFKHYIVKTYPAELREKVFDLSKRINGYHLKRIYTNFFLQLEIAKRSLKEKLIIPPPNWANKSWAYVYVDKFGVKIDSEYSTFDNFIENLDYYKEKLKVSNLYLLPVNKSPKMDGGYDVSDYKSIDKLIGGNKGFKRFMKAVRSKNINVMIDFVPGHTSRDHTWFQKALQGDQKYKDYYLNSDIEIKSQLLEQNGNTYRIYYGDNGEQYKRLLLFPDIESHHWTKETLANNKDTYFYSSFYSFQKDLNLQNPDVLSEHLNTLGWWINQGVSGIRADAISWWTKLAGTEGQHLKETLVISEYFNTFLKYLNKESLFLPELVDAPETAVRYLGPTSKINGSIGGANSNAVFEFEKSVQILYAGVSGDFTDHYKFLNRTRALAYPENTQSIMYSANHHDEIYLGFLSKKAKEKFQSKIKLVGGLVYKGGNSGGAMLADLLKGDHYKMFQFYKFLFAHKGAVAVYQGSALGMKNAWKDTYRTTYVQLKEMVETGRLKKDGKAFIELENIIKDPEKMKLPPKEDGELMSIIDGRLLHRSKITREMIDKAMNGENKFFNLFSKLPSLKESSKALNGHGVEEPLDTLRSDIGSFMRRDYDENGKVLEEVAIVKNGSDQHTVVHLNRSQLTKKDKFLLKELESKENFEYSMGHDEQSVLIKLKPYETLWLEVH